MLTPELSSLKEKEDVSSAKGKKRAVLFLVGPIFTVIVLAGLVAYKQRLFEATDRLFSMAPSANGLVVGMQVKVHGFGVGTVTELALVPGEASAPTNVRITMQVDRSLMKLIDKSSTVTVARDGLFGQGFIEINPGPGKDRRVADSDVLVYVVATSLGDMAKQWGTQVDPILGSARLLMSQATDDNGDLQNSVHALRKSLEASQQLVASAEQMVANTDLRLKNVEGRLASALEASERVMVDAGKQLPRVENLLNESAAAAKSARETIDELRAPLQRAAIAGLETAEGANELVTNAKKSWLLNQWVTPVQGTVVDFDSQLAAPLVLPLLDGNKPAGITSQEGQHAQ